MKRRLVTVTDVVLVLAVAVAAIAAAAAAASGGDGLFAEVTWEDRSRVIDLMAVDEEYDMEIVSCGIRVVLTVDRGSIRVKSSECPDGVCVSAGELTRPGQCAVCMPARLTVRLYGSAAGSEVDAVL